MSAKTRELSTLGVSLWLDDLSRERMDTGNLRHLIESFNVVGVTTNPTIFQAAISQGAGYRDDIALHAKRGSSAEETVFALMVDDVARACDMFEPLYKQSAGVDGRVSIEVSPELAHDTERTIEQASDLAHRVGRENVLVKIPATLEGLPAITETLGRGVSVNVTLIFSLERYRQVVEAYLQGIELAASRGHAIDKIHSVASFFVSRVDTEIDARLDAVKTVEAEALRSRAAVANARLAYREWERLFSSSRAQTLIDKGMNLQRPLWASTGVKDPALPETLYVTELAVSHTVNTMPEKTLLATAEMTVPVEDRVHGHFDDAQEVLDALDAMGISYDDATQKLEAEGVRKFIDSWKELLSVVAAELESAR